ncbi:MAG: immune inhibitor A [Chloroflexi bacterium]|nr:immune inhibitor A [Chloroflexota bacterium]
MQSNNSSSTTAIIVGIVALLCCICLIVIGVGGYIFYAISQEIVTNIDVPTLVPFDIVPTNTPSVQITRPPSDQISVNTLELLETIVVPFSDPRELACRLDGKCNIPEVVAESAAPREVGEKATFWANDISTNENFEVDATLQYATPHVYFWVENGVDFDERDMQRLVDTFENEIYPTNREFFGSEWTPGVDGDPHIYILYTRGIGFSIAGYFSSADSLNPLAHEYSNAHEMFVFNADNTDLGGEFTYGVLAHEFQHMIHWYQDRNEATWLNEGFSELAAFLNEYDPGGFDWLYISDPDVQLNDWPNDQNATTPHYGASFIYLTYFLDRFGEEATQAVVQDPANGFDSIDNALRAIDATDPLTGQPISADDLFMDWAVTNIVGDGSVGDGRYVYNNYPDAGQASPTEVVSSCPQSALDRSVHQYGVDYIAIDCAGDFTLSFTGSTVTRLLPADPNSGSYAFWSNKGDDSDMTLTREFDFTNVSGPIEFTFNTWYDIETDYDYVYFLVSEDGVTWDIITTPSGTADDPSGNSYGWGYNDVTNDWMEETVDLSAYAGKKVQVRFEYVTDAAVNGEGFLIDDVRVDAVGYSTDFETDDGGWVGEGFVRVENVLPQTFRLALIIEGRDGTTVQMIELTADQVAEIPLSLESGERAILVVSGTTRFTRELAAYQVEVR